MMWRSIQTIISGLQPQSTQIPAEVRINIIFPLWRRYTAAMPVIIWDSRCFGSVA
jgi:hypothetical protein